MFLQTIPHSVILFKFFFYNEVLKGMVKNRKTRFFCLTIAYISENGRRIGEFVSSILWFFLRKTVYIIEDAQFIEINCRRPVRVRPAIT